MSLKLNIGGGEVSIPGFLNVDRQYGDEAYPLRLANSDERAALLGPYTYAKFHRDEKHNAYWTLNDGCVDEIRASHVLEHFGHEDSQKALREWVRVLKPGGTIKIAVPDLDKLIEAVNAGNPHGWPIQGFLYGGQTDENDYHRTGFNEEWLRHSMESAGLTNISHWSDDVPDTHNSPCSLNLMGQKPAQPPPLSRPFPKHRKITAVMSMPRLAFADNMFCALQTFTPLQIPFEKVTGAFWGPCLTRIMEPHLDDGTEWIVALDYDTIFTPRDFHQLCVLMEEHPEADAIAPIQFKRDEDTHLFRPIDETTGEYRTGQMPVAEMEKPLTRVGWAHFGLTLIRTSALKKMKRPWFLGVPDKDGRWGDDRVDDDIYFWNNFRASGNKLYLANHVSIGHLQLMATWADQEFKPLHQYISNFHRNGKPQGVRQ